VPLAALTGQALPTLAPAPAVVTKDSLDNSL